MLEFVTLKLTEFTTRRKQLEHNGIRSTLRTWRRDTLENFTKVGQGRPDSKRRFQGRGRTRAKRKHQRKLRLPPRRLEKELRRNSETTAQQVVKRSELQHSNAGELTKLRESSIANQSTTARIQNVCIGSVLSQEWVSVNQPTAQQARKEPVTSPESRWRDHMQINCEPFTSEKEK